MPCPHRQSCADLDLHFVSCNAMVSAIHFVSHRARLISRICLLSVVSCQFLQRPHLVGRSAAIGRPRQICPTRHLNRQLPRGWHVITRSPNQADEEPLAAAAVQYLSLPFEGALHSAYAAGGRACQRCGMSSHRDDSACVQDLGSEQMAFSLTQEDGQRREPFSWNVHVPGRFRAPWTRALRVCHGNSLSDRCSSPLNSRMTSKSASLKR